MGCSPFTDQFTVNYKQNQRSFDNCTNKHFLFFPLFLKAQTLVVHKSQYNYWHLATVINKNNRQSSVDDCGLTHVNTGQHGGHVADVSLHAVWDAPSPSPAQRVVAIGHSPVGGRFLEQSEHLVVWWQVTVVDGTHQLSTVWQWRLVYCSAQRSAILVHYFIPPVPCKLYRQNQSINQSINRTFIVRPLQ